MQVQVWGFSTRGYTLNCLCWSTCRRLKYGLRKKLIMKCSNGTGLHRYSLPVCTNFQRGNKKRYVQLPLSFSSPLRQQQSRNLPRVVQAVFRIMQLVLKSVYVVFTVLLFRYTPRWTWVSKRLVLMPSQLRQEVYYLGLGHSGVTLGFPLSPYKITPLTCELEARVGLMGRVEVAKVRLRRGLGRLLLGGWVAFQ